MIHQIPLSEINRHTRAPSQTTVNSVASLHENIRGLLNDKYETFLQGSYRNDTAISDLNDVDIVAVQRGTYRGVYAPGIRQNTIDWLQIFREIQALLDQSPYYRGKVTWGMKCLKVSTSIKADVVPAVVRASSHLSDPVAVYSFRDQKEKLTYPRIHIANCTTKQRNTNDMFKPTVRLFKNWARRHFPEGKVVPSYYVESAVYAASNHLFHSDLVETFLAVGQDITGKIQAGRPILSPAGDRNILAEWVFGAAFFQSQLLKSLDMAMQAARATSQIAATISWKAAIGDLKT